ncbi:MAG: hypothetical protein J6331_03610 [Lentisphaeria bacterium]|nr:hypothetical protein [Lentisphaeria bacterium]
MNIFLFFMNIRAKSCSKSTTERPICLPREKVSSRKKQVPRGGWEKTPLPFPAGAGETMNTGNTMNTAPPRLAASAEKTPDLIFPFPAVYFSRKTK